MKGALIAAGLLLATTTAFAATPSNESGSTTVPEPTAPVWACGSTTDGKSVFCADRASMYCERNKRGLYCSVFVLGVFDGKADTVPFAIDCTKAVYYGPDWKERAFGDGSLPGQICHANADAPYNPND